MNSLRPAFMPCIPAMRTGRCLRSRARSAAVTSTTAAPSLTMQQSKSLSGSTTMREAWWSATLMGFCITAFGLSLAWARSATGTAASSAPVVP